MTDLECPCCGGQLDRLTCEDCGARYQEVLGIPFIGEYERANILGLIEIATYAALPVSPMSPRPSGAWRVFALDFISRTTRRNSLSSTRRLPLGTSRTATLNGYHSIDLSRG